MIFRETKETFSIFFAETYFLPIKMQDRTIEKPPPTRLARMEVAFLQNGCLGLIFTRHS